MCYEVVLVIIEKTLDYSLIQLASRILEGIHWGNPQEVFNQEVKVPKSFSTESFSSSTKDERPFPVFVDKSVNELLSSLVRSRPQRVNPEDNLPTNFSYSYLPFSSENSSMSSFNKDIYSLAFRTGFLEEGHNGPSRLISSVIRILRTTQTCNNFELITSILKSTTGIINFVMSFFTMQTASIPMDVVASFLQESMNLFESLGIVAYDNYPILMRASTASIKELSENLGNFVLLVSKFIKRHVTDAHAAKNIEFLFCCSVLASFCYDGNVALESLVEFSFCNDLSVKFKSTELLALLGTCYTQLCLYKASLQIATSFILSKLVI